VVIDTTCGRFWIVLESAFGLHGAIKTIFKNWSRILQTRSSPWKASRQFQSVEVRSKLLIAYKPHFARSTQCVESSLLLVATAEGLRLLATRLR
jgi:hypothetical protein